jgi:hypothetical protein
MFDADGPFPAQNGGGDLRFTSDPEGSNLLPCEVVTFVTDNDPANGVAEVWVKVPNVRSSQADTIYCWYNSSVTGSQPAVTAPHGRNAVWTSFHAVWHMNNASATAVNDSAGNYNTTKVATDQPLEVNGKIGKAQNMGLSAAHYLSAGDVLDLDGGANFSVQFWASGPNQDTYYRRVISKETLSTNGWAIIRGGTLNTYFITRDGRTVTGEQDVGAEYTENQWHQVCFTVGSNYSLGYFNGVENPDGGGAWDGNIIPNTQPLRIGQRADSATQNQGYDGLMDEVRIANLTLSADWIATDYQNQNDPGSFVSAGEPISIKPYFVLRDAALVQQSSLISTYESAARQFFSADGLRMYAVGNNSDAVHQFSMSTPWDLSTLSFVRSYTIGAATNGRNPQSVWFSPDGSAFFTASAYLDTVRKYSCPTPWDISTATETQTLSVATQTGSPIGAVFSLDGTKVYVNAGSAIYQYVLGTAWDLTTGSYDNKSFSFTGEFTYADGIFVSEDGRWLYATGSSVVRRYYLSTTWDISTAVYSGDFFDLSAVTVGPIGIFVGLDGNEPILFIMTDELNPDLCLKYYPRGFPYSGTSIRSRPFRSLLAR